MQPGLIDQLIAIQQREHWTDGQVADLIGINRTTWLKLRSGDRDPGVTVLRGIYRTIDELRPAVEDFLLSSKVSTITTP